jgi:hypothetical protein
MKKLVAVLLGLVLLGGQGKAHADVVVATFSGEVGFVYDPTWNGHFTEGIHPGSTFIATVRYDANASPLTTNGTDSATYAFLSSSLRLGNRVFDLDGRDPSVTATITVVNDQHTTNPFSFHDGLTFLGMSEGDVFGPGEVTNFSISLLDRTQSVFSSLALPTSLDIEQFPTGHSFGVALKPAGNDFFEPGRVEGSVTSVSTARVPTAQAPEPSTLALLVTGGVGLLGIARRRRPCSGSCPPRP